MRRITRSPLEQLLKQKNARIEALEKQLAAAQAELKAAHRTIESHRTEIKDLKRSIEMKGGSVIKPTTTTTSNIKMAPVKEDAETTKKVKVLRPSEIKSSGKVLKKEENYSPYYTHGPFDGLPTNKGMISALNKLSHKYPNFYTDFMAIVEAAYEGDMNKALSEFANYYFDEDGHQFDYSADMMATSESGLLGFLDRADILAEKNSSTFKVDFSLYVI